MTTIQLIKLIINAQDKTEIIKLLNDNRIPVKKSKYC